MRTRSRTSKPLLLLLAALIVLLVRGTIRQRRILRLLAAFIFTYPGEGAVDTIGGWFGGIGSDIRDYVERVIRVVADALQAGIDWVLSVAYGAASLAWDLVNVVKDWVVGLLNTLSGWVASLFWGAIDYAQRAVDVVAAGAKWLFDQVTAFASSLFWAAIDFAQRAIDAAGSILLAFIDGVQSLTMSLFNRANELIHTLIAWVFEQAKAYAGSLVDTARNTLTTIIQGAKDELGGAISSVSDYVFGTAQTIIDAVIEVLDWVLAVAAFPFTTAREIWAAFRQTGGATILRGSPDFVDRWGAHVLDHATTYAATDRFDYQLPDLAPHPGSGGGGGGGGAVGGVGTPDRVSFATQLLPTIGAPITDSSTAFLVAWMARENTTASFNPLATTLDYGVNTKFNDIGVRNYADQHTGIEATARTLLYSGYPTIVAALRAGDGHAAGQAHADLHRWSGGGYDTINV